MKRLLLVLLMLFITSTAFALTEEEANSAVKAYTSFTEQLQQAAPANRSKRSTSTVILEGWVASGSKGLTFASQQFLSGPITKSVLAQIATPVYVESSFGLYSYQGYVVQAWYVSDLASLITLMVYSD